MTNNEKPLGIKSNVRFIGSRFPTPKLHYFFIRNPPPIAQVVAVHILREWVEYLNGSTSRIRRAFVNTDET